MSPSCIDNLIDKNKLGHQVKTQTGKTLGQKSITNLPVLGIQVLPLLYTRQRRN